MTNQKKMRVPKIGTFKGSLQHLNLGRDPGTWNLEPGILLFSCFIACAHTGHHMKRSSSDEIPAERKRPASSEERVRQAITNAGSARPWRRGRHMPVSDHFLDYLLDQLSGWGGVSIRRMFGGAGLYRDGKMFGLVADDTAYLKVDDSNRNDFVQAGSRPFRPNPDKPGVMSYYEIPPEVLEQPDELVEWSERALAIQVRNSG